MPETVREIPITSWEHFVSVAQSAEYRSWAFRGHTDASWKLVSTLSRYLSDFQVHRDAWVTQETRILRIFRRKAHLLATYLPIEGDAFEWLALMQHHGAPTRLLDVTWSPFVAAFFALERATKDAAIWAICPPRLTSGRVRTIRASQKDEPDEIGPWVQGNYEKYFLPGDRQMVMIGEPQRMNQRLVAQSGSFLMPGVLDRPVEEIILEQAGSSAIVKFVLPASVRREGMRALYAMNITNATLFPGVDGTAKSLAFELESHWAFDPITNDPYPGYYTD